MPAHLLLVEDDTEIREALSELLQASGYAVTGAAHGREALDLLQAGLRPNVIILDIMMPVMDGWEFRAEQTADRALAPIPVIVLTAMGRAEETGRALRASAALAKPFDLSDLFHAIERATLRPSHRATVA